ncbi:hypothetical protein [Croceibacterium xixiisoli]|nr:hypothetical protein [Croceibacterium xixiisoli]
MTATTSPIFTRFMLFCFLNCPCAPVRPRESAMVEEALEGCRARFELITVTCRVTRRYMLKGRASRHRHIGTEDRANLADFSD